MKFFSILHCEIRKIIRANVFWLVFLVFAFGAIMMGVGSILSKNTGDINWQLYLTELLNNLAALGLIGYTFIAAWPGYLAGSLRIKPSRICLQNLYQDHIL